MEKIFATGCTFLFQIVNKQSNYLLFHLSVGTADEHDKAEKLVAECEADVMKCADVIAFMKTDAAKEHLGAEAAAGILAHEEELLAKGIEYCDCPGCTAGKRVMDNKALFLA